LLEVLLVVVREEEGGNEFTSTSHPFDVESGLVLVFMDEIGSGEGEEPFFRRKSRFAV